MKADWIQILADPVDVAAAIEFVKHADAGGINVFLGTTRSEAQDTRALVALDYEAYPEMALRQMQSLALRARETYPIIHLTMLHRTGRVPLAEPSVLIAVSTPHRAEAFAACRSLIDSLKAEVPIWKKEIWADGGESWVEGCEVR